jgi:hypothetical protein
MSYYIRQTFERYSMMVTEGYIEAEFAFCEEGDSTTTKTFDPSKEDHVSYADTHIGKNLQLIFEFIMLDKGEKKFVEKHFSDGAYAGGMNDFLYETLPPCLLLQSLIRVGVMEVPFDSRPLDYLLIHFFAKLKLIYGSLDDSDCPELDLVLDHVSEMNIDYKMFSFRELTLLSGYKTERAVRNLASKSTPEHRQIKVIKNGRKTLIEHKEIIRWLESNKK